MINKQNLGIHFGTIANSKSFEQAYDHIKQNPGMVLNTTGNSTPFISEAKTCGKDPHLGEKVIIFKTKTNKNVETEKARSYQCCWGHKTNCNKTHIDCFTLAI